MKQGFTLAETLITIGIIGIVAAMTLPVVIAEYQKQVTINQLKAAYQMFSEIINQAKLDHGNPLTLTNEILPIVGAAPQISKLYFEPYIKGVQTYKGKYISVEGPDRAHGFIEYKTAPSSQAPVCIPNGICFWIFHHGRNYTHLIFDLNGPKKPNIAGKDVFKLDISGKYVPGYGIDDIDIPKPFENDIEKLCSKTYVSGNGDTCASRIIKNNWKINKDYPW